MESVIVNKFRNNSKIFVDAVANQHKPLRVTRKGDQDFIVVSLEDWEREQETLYVLQNADLMRQINAARKTHARRNRCMPSKENFREIDSI